MLVLGALLTCLRCLPRGARPQDRLLEEHEWRGLGVQQSRGWVHYAIHRPEPHILLFRRPLGTDPTTGRVDPALERQAKERYDKEFGVDDQVGGAAKH